MNLPLIAYSANDTTSCCLSSIGIGCSGSIVKIFNISATGASGPIPMEIGFLKGLEKLDLSENQLNGSIPSSIGHLKELEELHLNNNNLTGSIPKEVGNLVKLVSLNLGANQFF